MSISINCQPEMFLFVEPAIEMTSTFLDGAPECTTLKIRVGGFPNDHEFTIFAPPGMHDRLVAAAKAFNAALCYETPTADAIAAE